MSLMMCNHCDRPIDTDFDVGIHTADFMYVCSGCSDEYQLYRLVGDADTTSLTLKELMEPE